MPCKAEKNKVFRGKKKDMSELAVLIIRFEKEAELMPAKLFANLWF